MYRMIAATSVIVCVTTLFASSTLQNVSGASDDGASTRPPQTMREALRDPAAARALFVESGFVDLQVSDVRLIASALGLGGKVARRLPIVDKWEVGWFDIDGTFVADPTHDLVDSIESLGWFSKIRVLGGIAVDLSDIGRVSVLPGDLNNDGVVDHFDLDIVLINLGRTGTDLTRFDGDLNGDRIVDSWDLLSVLQVLWDI